MSVKVVSPTDSGQPQLPMSLRPPVTPAAAGTHHGRPRRTRPTPDAEARPRPSAVADPGQPELPMSLRPQVAEVDGGRPELPTSVRRPAAGADSGQAELPTSSHPKAADADRGRSEPPAPLRLPAAHADGGQPEPSASLRRPTAGAELEHSSVPAAESGQPEPPTADAVDSEPTPRPESLRLPAAVVVSEPPAAERGQSELPMSLRPPAAAVAAEPAAADHRQSELPMSLRPPAPPVAAGLLAQARRGLAEAERETAPAERFIGAYLAALRGAAAVLAARGRPHRGRARPASTWVLLDSVAPELREWSAFFASNSAARAAAQAGITGKVTAESATELVRAATPFLELVRRLVHGLPITGEAHVA
ncbi:SAV_6107 family HEPN domain-containing protein [Amycolatopsis mongoliensis]|uniref:SAV_6107 family HEPN domain-containing protein n=2 Tax=Amycolatopsis mongoliensis TaxID=715475 RepID=A0A9Y2NJ14_9PSEU|nr:SAV_6107 family HEPN domain-containing protein [Amycolatopsis sp. 4-36]WIY07022.1 SAV_6107 family HEPN domain-containing protein [Amycolatopsis sp. 4-36]